MKVIMKTEYGTAKVGDEVDIAWCPSINQGCFYDDNADFWYVNNCDFEKIEETRLGVDSNNLSSQYINVLRKMLRLDQ